MKSWSDFFQSSPSDNKGGFTSRLSFTSGTVYVFNSFFESLTNLAGNGGAIDFSSSSDSSILLVEETTILNCICSQNGGGVFFYNKGNAVLHKICAFNCSSTEGGGVFYYNYVSDSKIYKSEVNFSTFSSVKSTRNYAIYLRYGTIQVSKTNESFINCLNHAGLRLGSSGSDGELMGTVSYSTFYNNTATSSMCVFFAYCTARIQNQMVSCNVIKNAQSTSANSNGIIEFNEATGIQSTSILQNSGGQILYNNYADRIVSLSNCATDFGSQTRGSITIKNVPATTFINSLVHLAIAECEAMYKATTKQNQIACFTIGEVQRKAIQHFLSLQNNLFSILCLISGE
jgi:hypothetical protein